MQKLLKKLRSDKGDSELVSLLIILPLVLGIMFTMIDVSMFFSNRALIQNTVRDSARSVAIMGGNGTNNKGTPIELKYGLSRSASCSGLSSNPMVSTALKPTTSAIECQALSALANNKSLVEVTVTEMTCSPQKTDGVGVEAKCTASWTYGHISGSAMSLIQMGDKNTTSASSRAETDMTGISLVARS